MIRFPRAALTALVVISLTAPGLAQTSSVTQSDIQRLQDNVYLAERDLSQLRGRDSGLSTQLQTELDDLRDEVIYLKVKLRKERTLARAEYADVRDRIEDLRTRARGDSPVAATPPAPAPPAAGATTPPTGIRTPQAGASAATPPGAATAPAGGATTSASGAASVPAGAVEIPVGTEMDVRLQRTLNSGTDQVEDRFEATTVVDLTVNGRTVIPAGAVARGIVTSVEPGTRTNRTARMTISFDQVTVHGRPYPMRGTVTQAIQGEGIRGEAGRIGAGAGVGAVIGGILGGVRGALAGVLIGGGGTIAATEGREVELPQGSVLRVRFDSPLQIHTQ